MLSFGRLGTWYVGRLGSFMANTVARIIQRAVDPAGVEAASRLTDPRSYGVYQLPYTSKSDARFRFGNHPVRMQELDHEFGSCTLTFLFLSRDDAETVARA